LIGKKVVGHQIIELLGVGGMGEVYRAHDPKLSRDVAIKVLPEAFAEDSDRIARFKREAKLLASLNHPGIAAIYGLEEEGDRQFIVMELVEGETIADRLGSQGWLDLDEALTISRQIARALEAAHNNGVVHRDLKPANVKITPDEKVKILDFGLAKACEADGSPPESAPDLSQSPTVAAATRAGLIMGTAPYMSPEQARGKTVDKRTDIWAFGCLLYEMISGQRAFGGETASDTIAVLLKEEPNWSALPADLPPAIGTLLRRCLRKEPGRRLHDVADARIEIEDTLAGTLEPGQDGGGATAAGATLPDGSMDLAGKADSSGTAKSAGGIADPTSTLPRRRPLPVIVAAMAALLVGLLVGTIIPRPGSPARGSLRATVPPPDGGSFDLHPISPGPVAVSPNGTRLVFTGRSAGGSDQLWVRRLDEMEARPLVGTEEATFPFWSPDSRFIAFFADGKLKKVEAVGGPAISLADAGAGKGGSWNNDGVILFASGDDRIHRVSSDGGESVAVTRLDTAAGERDHRHPRFLPDGERFLFVARASRDTYDQGHRLMVGSLSGEEPRELMRTLSHAEIAAGHLWFVRDGAVLARPFDMETLEFIGATFPVADGAVHSGWAAWEAQGYFSVSPAGVIAFHTGGPVTKSILTWYDRDGKALSTVGEEEYQYHLSISPDYSQAAVQLEFADQLGWNLWLYDLRRGIKSRFTSHPSANATPVWSPDGERVLFASTRAGELLLYTKPAGGGDAEPLLEGGPASYGGPAVTRVWPLDWSPDGRHVVYFSLDDDGNADLWALPLEDGLAGDEDGGGGRSGGRRLASPVPIPMQQTPYREDDAAISPDGLWLAYTSDEGGRFEIYVTAFPEGGRRWLVSANGGIRPEWSPAGDELFFLDPDGMLMAARVEAVSRGGPDFQVRPDRAGDGTGASDTARPDGAGADAFIVHEIDPLFPAEVRHYTMGEPGQYAVGPRADSFLVNRLVETGTSSPLALIVGWPEELHVRAGMDR
jgi:Tol biopolymer transport system component